MIFRSAVQNAIDVLRAMAVARLEVLVVPAPSLGTSSGTVAIIVTAGPRVAPATAGVWSRYRPRALAGNVRQLPPRSGGAS
jgi:hypothetical protein